MKATKILSEIRFFLYEKKEAFLKLYFIRTIFFCALFLKYFYYTSIVNQYEVLSAPLRYERDIKPIVKEEECFHYRRIYNQFVSRNILHDEKNIVLESYVSSKEAENFRRQFQGFGLYNRIRIRYPEKRRISAGKVSC